MTSHDAMNEAIRTAFSASKKAEAQAPPDVQEPAQEPRRRVSVDAGEGNLPENNPESGGAWARTFNDAVRKAARR